MKKIGFIDYYLHEWHADNIPKWVSDATNNDMQVCYAWGEIDHPEGGKTNKQWSEEMGIPLCESIEEVIEKSDYLIVLSPDNPERHIDLCKLPLTSGKRTYVDKTFATIKAEAEYMMNLAKKSNTPFYTTSALRYAREFQEYPREKIEYIDSKGPGTFKNYAIHQIEPVVFMMNGCADRVLASVNNISREGNIKPTLIYEYSNGRRAVMHMFGDDIGFSMTIQNKDGTAAELKIESDFFADWTKDLVNFFITGEVSFPVFQTIDVAAMLEAGNKAVLTPGVWVNV